MVLRLDMLLVSLNLVKSRERAKEMIKQSLIKVDGKIVNKPSVQVDETSAVQLLGNSLQYVGRGGLKLEKAINVFNLDFLGKVCIDIGASTGGFTDCMLQNGAKKVYAIDVGHSQLDKKLLDDSRVINLEKTNIREVNDYIFDEKIDFITIDVSFISLKLVLPKVKEILKNGEFVALIKPQFEAGKADVGKKGIVKSPKIHIKVLEEIVQLVGINFAVKALDFSPISGGDGNIEYLLNAATNGVSTNFNIKQIVTGAFKTVKG